MRSHKPNASLDEIGPPDVMCESEQHHVLIMIEAAQRAGRTEAAIVRLVEAELGASRERERIVAEEHRLIGRLLARKKLPNAA